MIDSLYFLFQFVDWLFVLIGTGIMLAGVVYLLRLAWRLKHAQTADGMVVGFVQKTDRQGQVHYFPQVCFTCRGQEYTVTAATGLPAETYDRGQKVQVFFPPQQPEAANIKSFVHTWLFGLLLLVFGTLFAGVSLAFL